MRHGPYQETQCKTCGVWHCIPKVMYDGLQETGGYYHCPNGHQWGWRRGRKETDALKLERDRLAQDIAYQQDRTKEAREQRDAARRSASAYKGAATRMKNRAKAGVCPCCNRTFQNLAKHMASQHPDQHLDNVVELGQEQAS